MLANAQFTLELTRRLIGGVVLLQAVELLQVREVLGPRGIWRSAWLAPDFEALPFPFSRLTAWLLAYPAVVGVLLLQAFAGLASALTAAAWLGPILLAASVLINLRFRGTYNGGSDYMTVLILLAVSGSAVCGDAPLARTLALGYIVAQTMMSYAIAGFVKLKESDWRNGRNLSLLLMSDHYRVPEALARRLARPAISRLLSLALIALESSFPLALLRPALCVPYLAACALLHFANAIVLGLNRFLWAWLAAYPAVLHVAALIAAIRG